MAEVWTQDHLEKVGRWWQDTLFLGNWRATFVLVTEEDSDIEDGVRGMVNYNSEQMLAEIKVVDQSTLKEPGKFNITEEESLVHELLHLHTTQLQWPYEWHSKHFSQPLYEALKEQSNHAEEQMINHLARVLVAFKYTKAAVP